MEMKMTALIEHANARRMLRAARLFQQLVQQQGSQILRGNHMQKKRKMRARNLSLLIPVTAECAKRTGTAASVGRR